MLYFISNITCPKDTEVIFHFKKNPYFTNEKLSLDFESGKIVPIDWFEVSAFSLRITILDFLTSSR